MAALGSATVVNNGHGINVNGARRRRIEDLSQFGEYEYEPSIRNDVGFECDFGCYNCRCDRPSKQHPDKLANIRHNALCRV